jgi:hypothetical protein
MMDYQNNIPYDIFNVKFTVNDPKIGSSSITLLFNSVAGGISNALNPNAGNDFLT